MILRGWHATTPMIPMCGCRCAGRCLSFDHVGEIRHNLVGNSLDAHCALHKNCKPKCAINRTINGRPKGYLVAWLRSGRHGSIPGGPDGRAAHFQARKGQGDFAFLANGRGPERLAGRDYATDHLSGFPERPRRAGEPEEPPGLPS